MRLKSLGTALVLVGAIGVTMAVAAEIRRLAERLDGERL